MTRRFLLATVLVSLSACAPVGTLSGRYVFLTGNESVAVGQANTPSGGGPLHLLPGTAAAGACMTDDEFKNAFGETCEEHEPENATPGAEALVRWYCSGEIAVRVRLERCERGERFRVAELAVATH